MKQEAKKVWYYLIFDEVTGSVYEGGEGEVTRAEALDWIQDRHYYFLKCLKDEGRKTKADQLRSIIKDDREAAIREYKLMTGRE